jgi:predicted nucleic acid-binding protein
LPISSRIQVVASRRLLQAIEVLPFDGESDRAYAEVRAMLEGLGRPSGANDLLIAAHAVNETVYW